MLKTFAYFALADGEGILMRSLMENDADDLEMLYRRVLPIERMFTDTSFAWQNQSFMSQITGCLTERLRAFRPRFTKLLAIPEIREKPLRPGLIT